MTVPQSPQQAGPVLGEEAGLRELREYLTWFAGYAAIPGDSAFDRRLKMARRTVDRLAALLTQARADGVEEGREVEREHWQPLLAEECARSRDLRARLNRMVHVSPEMVDRALDARRAAFLRPDSASTDRDLIRAALEAVADDMRADGVREVESAPWLLDLVHAAETAAAELGCNGDHEANEGCDGCAWEALAAAVPARVRNAADEAASKP